MAKRKFLLAIGQSNSTAIGDAQSWEDNNPLIRIRSPQATPSQVSQGSYGDYFTMPSTFPGGPQTGRFGEGPKRGSWQSFDLKGLAAQNVKMLTFYDPIASYFNLGSGYTIRYPGTCTTLAGCTQDKLVSTAYWQYDPVGLKVTRKKTGIEHTISSGWVGLTNQATVTPAMIPPPEPGEDFTYEIRLESSAAGKVRFTSMFGGLSDLGMVLEPADTTARFGNILNAAGAPIKAVMKYSAKPLPDNACIQFKRFLGFGDWDQGASPPTYPQTLSRVSYASENGELLVRSINSTNGLVEHGLNNGDRVRVGVSGGGSSTLPTGLSSTTTYFVVKATPRTFKLSTTLGGTPEPYINSGTIVGAEYFDVRRGVRIAWAPPTLANTWATNDSIEVQTRIFYPNGLGGGASEVVNWEFEENQPIAINWLATGSLPTGAPGLALNTIYYIKNLSQVSSGICRFQFSETPGGAPLVLNGGTAPSTQASLNIVYAPETLYVSRKLKSDATMVATASAGGFNASQAYGIMEGERVRFSSALPIPSPFVAGKDYFIIRRIDLGPFGVIENDLVFQLAEYLGGTAIPFAASQLVAIDRVDLPYMYEITNAIGSTNYVFPASSGTAPFNTSAYKFTNGEVNDRFAAQASFGMRVLETWRGSLSGVKLRSISGANLGQSVTLGDITYEIVGGQFRSTVAYTGTFSNAVANLDKFVMEPPMVGGVATPWHKWAYWLPWSPFEGRAYANGTQSGTLTASVGGAITYNGFFGEPLAKNTAIKFDSQQRVLRKDVVAADGNINGDPAQILGASTTTQLAVEPTRIGEIGYAIEFLTGALAGQIRNIVQDSVGVIYTDPFPAAPAVNDEYQVITVTRPTDIWHVETTPIVSAGEPINGWIGRKILFTSGALTGQSRTIIFCNPNKIRVSPGFTGTPAAGDTFDIVEEGVPWPMVDGKTYYVSTCTQSALTFSATYNGAAVTSPTGITNSGVVAVQYDQENKYNPYPPGFNYPNHYTPVAGVYQPYDGYKASSLQPKQGHYVGLGSRLYDYFGETMHVIPFAVGATAITHSELNIFGSDQGAGHAWYDPDQQLSWAPGEPNNCYARLMDVLDSAKNAFAANGDTGECVGIVWLQGENDAFSLDAADRYEKTCSTLKASIRSAIKERGLYSGSAHKIPWVHPKIRAATGWSYAVEINDAIDRMVESDPYSRTFSVEDATVMPDLVHYTGASMHLIATRAYDALLQIYRMGTSEVDICNLALANIGDSGQITSIDPPDGSTQATLCARFYPIARDSLLEMHPWDFATKRKSLEATDNLRTEWQYAYLVPPDLASVIAVLPPDARDDQYDYKTKVAQKYIIEADIFGKRILYTNQQDAHIRYTAKVADTTAFSQLFVIALSWHLSAMLAGPIIKGDVGAAEAKRCGQMMAFYMGRATQHDSINKQLVPPTHTAPWMSNR